jgi:hypothetical protein
MLTRLRTEEDGVAMVISLMVAFVILILSTVVVAQSIHTLDSSGYDRRRLTSVNAAEAGTNFYYQYFQTTPAVSLSCSAITRTVSSAPATSSFTATPTYYNASGTVMNCPFTDSNYPAYVLVNSVGTTSSGAQRTFQSYIKLTPNYGGFDGALFSNSGNVTFGNNFNLYGNSGNNADVYVVSGNYTENQNSNVRGSVYVANGSATMGNTAQIQGDLWAKNAAVVTTVVGDVTSTTSTISGGTVGGNAKAAGAITSTVAGTKSQNQAGIPNPPTQTFPQITYQETNWTNTGYTIHTYSGATACADARTFVEGTIPAGNHVVRITGPTPCTYTNSNNSTVTFNGNLAIITDWGIDISNQSNWNGVTTTRSLYFISVYQSSPTCANKAVSTGQNTNFNALVHVLFYTPCTLTLGNQNAFSGQGLGSPINISNQFNLTYQPVLVPGVTGIVGFDQDISYVREIV